MLDVVDAIPRVEMIVAHGSATSRLFLPKWGYDFCTDSREGRSARTEAQFKLFAEISGTKGRVYARARKTCLAGPAQGECMGALRVRERTRASR